MDLEHSEASQLEVSSYSIVTNTLTFSMNCTWNVRPLNVAVSVIVELHSDRR